MSNAYLRDWARKKTRIKRQYHLYFIYSYFYLEQQQERKSVSNHLRSSFFLFFFFLFKGGGCGGCGNGVLVHFFLSFFLLLCRLVSVLFLSFFFIVRSFSLTEKNTKMVPQLLRRWWLLLSRSHSAFDAFFQRKRQRERERANRGFLFSFFVFYVVFSRNNAFFDMNNKLKKSKEDDRRTKAC